MAASPNSRGRVIIVVVIVAVVALVTGLLVFLPSSPLRQPRGPEGEATKVAQRFLRDVQEGRLNYACTAVVDHGELLNPCTEDLSRRDLSMITELPRAIRVRGATLEPEGAIVGTDDIAPRPATEITLALVQRDDRWCVVAIDGDPIATRF